MRWITIKGNHILIDEGTLNETLSQHRKGDKVEITDVAIDKVQNKNIGDLNEIQSYNIYIAHRDILKHSKEHNDSNEVACVIDLSNECKRTEMIEGDQGDVSIGVNADAFHLYRTNKPNTLVVCHNHPGLSYFSKNDIEEFLSESAIKTMTIVTNRGVIWYIDKTEKYNGQEAFRQYRMCMSKHIEDKDWDKAVKEYLKVMEKKGIQKG